MYRLNGNRGNYSKMKKLSIILILVFSLILVMYHILVIMPIYSHIVGINKVQDVALLCTEASSRAIGRMDNINKIQNDTAAGAFEILKMFGEDIKTLQGKVEELETEKNKKVWMRFQSSRQCLIW